MTKKTKTTRELNDRLRNGDASVSGQIVFTRGIIDLLEEQNKEPDDLMRHVRRFDRFSPENDPHGEHDFGSIQYAGYTCFWKIDYYDLSLKWGSDDPSDVRKTTRVLTIMLASEY